MHETRELTRFVVETTFDSLPANVIRTAKERLLDLFGATLFATRTPWACMVRDMVVERSGRDDCTLWGSSHRADPASAALANGTQAHGYELDDFYLDASVHPGVTVVPAALAAAEQTGASGRDLLVAIVLGYEVQVRTALAVGPGHLIRGHHPTGTTGVFGATTGAGKVWGLSHKELLNAFGVAGSLASGILEFSQDPEGTMVKRLYGGRPAEAGVVATNLARRGFTGPCTVLEGRFGFLTVYSDASKPSILTDGLGQNYLILRARTKPYSACGSLHAMMHATEQILKEHGTQGVPAEAVKAVEIGFPRKTLEQNMIYRPRSTMAAQYSAPFSIGLALLGHGKDPARYAEDRLDDAAVLSIASKVKGNEDAEMESLYPVCHAARVRVTFGDGTVREVAASEAKGGPDNPFSYEEQEQRFDILAGAVLGAERRRELREAIGKLETIPDVRPFARMLAGN